MTCCRPSLLEVKAIHVRQQLPGSTQAIYNYCTTCITYYELELVFVEFLLTRDNKTSIGLGRYKSPARVFSILIGFGYFRNCLCSSVRAIERFSAS